MNRIRQMNGSDPILMAPPESLLTPKLSALLAEYREINQRHAQASCEDQDLRFRRGEHDVLAAKEDAESAASTARAGGDFSATPARDALDLRRRTAEQRVAALADALAAVRRDLEEEMMFQQSSDQAVRVRERANDALRKTAEQFATAIRNAAAAQGVTDWFRGLPYDSSAFVSLVDVAPIAVQNLGPGADNLRPADALQVVTAISRTLDSTVTAR